MTILVGGTCTADSWQSVRARDSDVTHDTLPSPHSLGDCSTPTPANSTAIPSPAPAARGHSWVPIPVITLGLNTASLVLTQCGGRPVTEPVGVVSVVHVRRTMKSDDAHPENALRRVFTPTANTFSTTSANVPSTVKY